MNDSSVILSELIHTVDELNKQRSQYNNNINTAHPSTSTSTINSNNIFKEYSRLQQYVKILENDKEQLITANKHLESKNAFRAKQIIAFEEDKLTTIKKEDDYLDHISDLMKTINTLSNEVNLARDELSIVITKNNTLNKKLDDMFIDEGKGSIIVQHNELKLSLIKLQSKYDDLNIINNQNQKHYNQEIKRLNDRLLVQDKTTILLRTKYEKLEDDYYQLQLELSETSSSLNKTNKMKESLEKFVKKNDHDFDCNLYYQYIDKLNNNDIDNNSSSSKGSSTSKLSLVDRIDNHKKIDNHDIITTTNVITHDNIIAHNNDSVATDIHIINDTKTNDVKVTDVKKSNDKTTKKKKVIKEKKTSSKEKPKTMMKLTKTNATNVVSKVNVISSGNKDNDYDKINSNENNDENENNDRVNIIDPKSILLTPTRDHDDINDNDTITDSVLSDLSFVQQQQQQHHHAMPNAIKRVVFSGIKKK